MPRATTVFTVLTLALLAAAFMFMPGCAEHTPAANAAPQTGDGTDALHGRLVITGSSTLGPLVNEIGRRFESKHPGVRVDVQTGGSSRGIADTVRGTAAIGMSSRRLADDEARTLEAHAVANDGVCFLVHASNPVAELSRDQLRAVFEGTIDNWQTVGGSDAPITVVDRAAGRSEVTIISEFLGIDASAIAPDVVAGENQHGIKIVAGDPNAITYMSVGTSEYEVGLGAPIRLLPIDGVPASAATVGTGRYPLNRPLILVTAPSASSLVHAFIEYARSSAVHDLVREQSFVPHDS